MKKSRALINLIGLALLLGGGIYVMLFGVDAQGTGAAATIKQGLDLAGGVSITYQVIGEEAPSSADMSDTIYKLQQRVESYSTEAQVYQEGADRINIEIPGVSDANSILEELGKPGSLVFMLEDGSIVLTGTDIKSANAVQSQNDMGNLEFGVSLTLNTEGTASFAAATSEAAKTFAPIYIIYDDAIISAPIVNTAITGGEAYISGMTDYAGAEILASTIRIGGLKLELEELRSNVVGAQLGVDAIRTSLQAGIIGLVIVMVFMIIVYLLSGVAATFALAIYTVLMVLLINAFELTLTLPGIAGIILSIGMAVDANVIIFARVREEIAQDISVKTAIQSGFKKAASAIVDGNITTLIAAVVLAIMGTGTVKGFAYTLSLGIVLSMFTALVITKMIIQSFYALGFTNTKFYGQAKQYKTINFIGPKNLFFGISLGIISIGLLVMGVNEFGGKSALNYSLEFVGGTSTNITFQEDYSIEEIELQIVPVVESITNDGAIQTQKVSGTNEVIIKTRSLNVEEREQFNEVLAEQFGVAEEQIVAETISSTISAEMRMDAMVAIMIATICMLIYIWCRFSDIRFAASAVIALLHDVLLVLAFYAVARVSVGNTFIACMLTIVGYSINATIVIFDRIRENLLEYKKKQDLKEVVNKSITQTLTRSVYTSFTTLVMVVVLYVLGVTSIREFALPLVVGIVGGAYSSVCITGSLWYLLRSKFTVAEED
ncbi:MAG: protein translocase subunit SecD [Eubacteriales bacterium]